MFSADDQQRTGSMQVNSEQAAKPAVNQKAVQKLLGDATRVAAEAAEGKA
jgi:hypothetical protein